MAFTLRELLPDDQKLRTVQFHDPVPLAISMMYEHKFNQLPVVASDGTTTKGEIVTFDSIVRAIQSLETKPETLQVRDVAITVQTYAPDADLLVTLDDIQRDSFALIVDETDQLTGIVTTADTTVFLRKYAQDIMQIEGIESQIKDAIQTLYHGDESGLQLAIDTVTDRTADARRKLPGALKAYLGKMQLAIPAAGADSEAVAELEKKLGLLGTSKLFEDLSFSEFTDVLLRHPNAPKLKQSNDVTELRTLLNKVRSARNKIAHFRGELSSEERDILQFASGWLERNLPSPPTIRTPVLGSVLPATETVTVSSVDEDFNEPVGSYSLLADFLRKQSTSVESLTVTFNEIEKVLEKKLPQSANDYRAWWSNDPATPQSAAWLDEGWRTTSISMTERRLTFVRTTDREDFYIPLFALLNNRLEKEPEFPLRKASPQGSNWMIMASMPWLRPDSANINAVFTRRKEFRLEIYIDSGDKSINKGYFDALVSQKEQIESTAGVSLTWERLDARRACRIAVYTDIRILPDASRELLIDWAAKMAVILWNTFKHEFAPLTVLDVNLNKPIGEAVLRVDEEHRQRYVLRLANVRAGLDRFTTDKSTWNLIDTELCKYPAPVDSDPAKYGKALVGNWRSPRHDYVYREDGTWSMLPAEEGVTRGVWRIDNDTFCKGTEAGKETRYTIILLDADNFIFNEVDTGAVYFERRLE